MIPRRLDLWFPSWVGQSADRARGRREREARASQADGPVHVLVVVCDHYEPRHGITRPEQADERVRAWREGYPALQRRCEAAFGTRPVHTFFYPPHHGDEFLQPLSEMVFDGLGEVELHYHHDGDTADTLRRDLRATLARYRRHGLLLQAGDPPGEGFAFIHGDWALDNSRGGTLCGVNGELGLLAELGCWGDFTMPSAERCQTRKINSIYYAVDDPARAKSHDRGQDATVGRVDPPGFFLMQGPLAMNWRAPDHPRVESASLTSENWGRADRIETWLDCNVHVKGRPEWLFVKLHTHGAIERDHDALFGDKAFEMHRLLHERCNDGRAMRLHYVTARQAYNIAKAAEAGHAGDPMRWADFRVAPQVNGFYAASVGHRVRACHAGRLSLDDFEAGPVSVRSRVGALRRIEGPLRGFELGSDGLLAVDCGAGEAEVLVDLAPGHHLALPTGVQPLAPDAGAAGRYRLRLRGPATLAIEAAEQERSSRLDAEDLR